MINEGTMSYDMYDEDEDPDNEKVEDK